MNISIEHFNRLSDTEKEFVLKYGANNCMLVKFSDNLIDTLFTNYGEESYYESDIALFESIVDDKWHIVYTYDDDEYFLCGDDNIVFFDDCFSETSNDINLYLKQQ